ncbi:ABC-type sodium efflux pump system ATPase component protein [Halorhabdus tiamatea SARL4B]|uniref:ABC-type sodium efflux pump system ATPase component protein n=1 Tax=Halorhabdus tiamatea SARL4B TaxID=1033806 RepID=U2F9X5_9EURY|nr:ABC transporter ATP-binding protein [Halorhabdus tiamatea]ERJ05289.1 ABC-type sodium efflux pump system ATPase component protein [Halorhabdus tiamatea SARL4B]
MAQAAVTVSDLAKRYGDVQALRGVSFSVEPGEIYGLVGPNGAGKSTTLRTLATLLTVGSGDVSVFGADVESEPNEVRKRIRYLPEDAGSYDNLTGRQYLEFVADFYGDDPDELVERGVEIADLDDRIESKTSEYSKGMTRKLLLASTIMTEPDLAILDEPTSGLDVENARAIREIVKQFPGANRSVLLSSHNMLEVEYLCDRIGLLNEGEIVAEGPPAELVERYGVENLEEAFLEAVA